MKGNLSKVSRKGSKGEQGERGYTPSVVFRLDSDGNLYYSSDGILLDKEYVASQHLVTIEQLEQKLKEIKNAFELLGVNSLPRTTTVNLLASNWVQTVDSQYAQVVSIDGVTERSQVDLQPTAEQLLIFYEKDISFVAENDNGVVTVYCIGQVPLNDYTIQATVTEVEIDG